MATKPINVYCVWLVVRLAQDQHDVDNTSEVFGATDNIEASEKLTGNVLMARESD